MSRCLLHLMMELLTEMFLLGMLLAVFLSGAAPSLPKTNCLEAKQVCLADPQCEAFYQTLEGCASDRAASLPGSEARLECLEALVALHSDRLLLGCKCHRGIRKEEHCLKVYWSLHFLQEDDEQESSPYEIPPFQMSRMASIVADTTLPLDGQNQCLKAAQDCGLYEKCGALRSEYVLACTKRIAGTDHCNRQKCHRALRRFLERVPEEYSLGLLFCPCTDTLCGERRRKTIVPSCSYQERDTLQPNCLHLQSYCQRDELCRSRLADFKLNCQPSGLSPSGCVRENGAACLKSYAGLIGTFMTPNYVTNNSMAVSLWCDCDSSGNHLQDCLRIQHMFTNNPCLRNSISSMGSFAPRPVESTPVMPPHLSPLDHQEELSNNALPELHSVKESEEMVGVEEDDQDQDQEEEGGQFDVIPLYAEKATVANLGSGAGGASLLAPGPLHSLLLLLLLLSACLSWG
ncbi:GDNF family receptor alpha-3 [Hypomesus transpacificus]|uniref:GDNF family receptor alpha-3 n=1 Tax=Hypomesus transpacificus TaxID=137520 RepID=UPI001F0801F7|nr:GDNF family receptor alpha-3 [Hypomesus transpacificus]